MESCLMETKQLKLEDIRPASYNPRDIDRLSLEGLCYSIERYGLVEPLVWNRRTNTLVAGHARVQALLELGHSHTDVIVVDLDPMDERSLNVTLNNPNIQGQFTDDKLGDLLSELRQHDEELFKNLNLDMLESGVLDVARLVDESPTPDLGEDSNPDEISVRPGDIWVIAERHRLGCGDSHDRQFVRLVFGGDEPDVAVIDPPFDFFGETVPWLEHLMDPCIVFGTAFALRHIPPEMYRFERVLVKPGMTVRDNQIGARHSLMVQCGTVRTNPTNKRVITDSVYIREEHTADKRERRYEKPHEMIMENLLHYTAPWEVVWDPYAGNGSTIVAAHLLGRRCFAVEISPEKCEFVLSRLVSRYNLRVHCDRRTKAEETSAAEGVDG
jgi:hypothetical protein